MLRSLDEQSGLETRDCDVRITMLGMGLGLFEIWRKTRENGEVVCSGEDGWTLK